MKIVLVLIAVLSFILVMHAALLLRGSERNATMIQSTIQAVQEFQTMDKIIQQEKRDHVPHVLNVQVYHPN